MRSFKQITIYFPVSGYMKIVVLCLKPYGCHRFNVQKATNGNLLILLDTQFDLFNCTFLDCYICQIS